MNTQKREKPILFSGPMVCSILGGKKTQTRRIIKPVRNFEHHGICKPEMAADSWAVWWHGAETDRVGCLQECPYGKPGDRLWVREAWRTGSKLDSLSWLGISERAKEAGYSPGCPIRYEASGTVRRWGDNDTDHFGGWGRYRHARFMPCWASRITLEITEVRVERLQEISEEDARAEGVEITDEWTGAAEDLNGRHVMAYSILWDSINGKASWKANPWVWALTFKRITPTR
jgi:hypothetical protein